MQTMNELFQESVERFGSRPAIIDEDRYLTYGEFGEAVNSLASLLAARGVGRGTRSQFSFPIPWSSPPHFSLRRRWAPYRCL